MHLPSYVCISMLPDTVLSSTEQNEECCSLVLLCSHMKCLVLMLIILMC